MVSGKYLGAVQRGLIAYDFPNRMTREDQALISGPSVNSSFTSNNMTEWFHNTTWYYMDWTTGVCQTTDFGWGQVRPDFMIASGYPLERGPPTFIDVYTTKEPLRRDYVNVSWIQVDGSAGFGGPPRSALRALDRRQHPHSQAWRRPHHLQAERSRCQRPLPVTT